MNIDIEEVKEWFRIADDDLYSAKILNESVHRPYEIICYHCSQAVEKYLKGYLVYNGIVPKKTHDLSFLNRLCIDIDENFKDIQKLCDYITTFANTRYPHRHETTENDVEFAIKATENIKRIKPIANLKNNF